MSPGIIDYHSHTAISRGVNESSHAVTCEVRIGDVIDATDIGLYRELAGGVTTANVLHGSANPMGGQNQVIKFRWGALPEELKFADAMPGVKFALGENVKQSNWVDKFKTRYPQTRMGVEQIRDRFRAAGIRRGVERNRACRFVAISSSKRSPRF
jgi:N-acetylglucosamine-6-phosphate deacetylase